MPGGRPRKTFDERVALGLGCHEWTGAKTGKGYGQFYEYDGPNLLRIWPAHRYAWSRAYGEPPEELFVCHHCDNPRCVRLDHLFLGSNQDNQVDARAKGRLSPHRGGAKNPRRKLSDDQVFEMIARYKAGGISQSQAAKEYGVSQALVSQYVRGVGKRRCLR